MEQEPGKTGVLVVHGIGAQIRGETLNKLISGLKRTAAKETLGETVEEGVPQNIGGRSVVFYEVYWADLLKGEQSKGSFRMDELRAFTWFPLLNLCRGNYRGAAQNPIAIAWWCLFLAILNFLILFGYFGASTIAKFIWGAQGVRIQRKRSRFGKETGRAVELSRVDIMADEYLGDVFSYLNSAGDAFHQSKTDDPIPEHLFHVYPKIVDRFYEQLVRACADDCESIQIVAHSLGTVVTFHGLSGHRFEAEKRRDAAAICEACSRVRHVYTIGSPLEKFRFLWPRIIPSQGGIADLRFDWDNFVSFFDPVAGKLKKKLALWGNLKNHSMLGGGFISGHVVYEHSPVFINAFARGLTGKDLSIERNAKEKWKDLFVLIGESLATPFLLLIILTLGAGLFVLTALAPAWIISQPLRLFMTPEQISPWIDRISLGILIMMVFVLFIASLLRAVEVHKIYWRQPESDSA